MFLRMLIKSRAFYSLVFFVFLSGFQVQAAVTVDSRSSGAAFSNTGVTNLSWTHTVGSGTNRAIVVGISTTSAAGTGGICTGIPGGCVSLPDLPFRVVTSITYNGMPMREVTGAGLPETQAFIYDLANPPTGAGTISVTFAAGVVTHAVGNSVSFFGVNQATPTTNTSSGSAGDPSDSPSTTVSGSGVTTDDLVFDTLASTPNAVFFLEGAGQTVCTNPADETTCTRGRRFFFNAYDVGASSTKQANPAGTTMSWTMTTEQDWSIAAAVVKAAPPVTAALSSISGQVRTFEGKPIALAHITAQNLETGDIFYTRTNQLGRYYFEGIESGRLYQVRVTNSRYSFSPDIQIFNLSDSFTNIDFIGTAATRRNKF